jgi:Secretion system C-terminal sorting domain
MKKLILPLLFCLALVAGNSQSPVRYLDATFFSTIRVDTTVTYGSNFSILAKLLALSPRTLRESLLTDIYRPPVADTATKRPLVIYLRTGNFFPAYTTGPNGSRRDSAAVEICTRLAQMGYVSASIDYRSGWAATVQDESTKRYTLINAAYRGIQDLNTAIRFFKANATTYGVDTNKIVVWGQGTGAYVTLGATALTDSLKFDTTTYGPKKFFFGPNRMVQPWVNGDLEGKTLTVAPTVYWDGILTKVDTMCSPNYAANTSKFHMQVNMGGALGDLNWIDNKVTVPMISFHVPYDQFAPYQDGTVFVNTARGPEPVIRAQGADSIQRKMDRLGLNAKINATKLKAANNPYQAIFNARNGGLVNGLFPLLGDTITDSSPWDFWNKTDPKIPAAQLASGLTNNPRMSSARAKRYIDTIMTIYTARACVVLGLPCASIVSGTEDILSAATTKLVISPNPALDIVTFASELTSPIKSIELYDLSGRMMLQKTGVNSSLYQLDRGSLPDGMYIAKVKFEAGILSKKIVFNRN